jgi:hypothetical protein
LGLLTWEWPAIPWEDIKDKTVEKIIDEINEKLRSCVDKKLISRLKDDCRWIENHSPSNDFANWNLHCQGCADLKCYLSATSAVGLSNCMTAKYSGCAAGTKP